ncbi:regulator [Salinibacterium sp. NG22]|uniref:PaaX family transcriptional regulator n=1 Tax=Salinibacterium sp. NG22 TaxID=2792040 RepID=UPI0018CD1AD2|nr:PaaX family transcriptional regulator C-terminal domain-containing protein [Salinibacterium sp. NG22]MBH0109895.1 regulator [Salinibacterium sp. NG22]
MILDDFDSRPGSATALLRTFVGSQLRQLGGWISSAHLVRIMEALGVSANGARSAIARVKSKGLLVPEMVDGQQGYRVNADAVPMLESGDRRVFSFRQQREDDPWCLISFSIPESRRDERHQLRRRLGWIGCGTVATGLWICPAHLKPGVLRILEHLELSECATLFIAGRPETTQSFADAVAQWWDLDRLRELHDSFLAQHSALVGPASTDAEAFACYIHALDQWRVIPYVDPGLPDSALPEDWPGRASVDLFGRLSRSLAARAHAFVRNSAQ